MVTDLFRVDQDKTCEPDTVCCMRMDLLRRRLVKKSGLLTGNCIFKKLRRPTVHILRCFAMSCLSILSPNQHRRPCHRIVHPTVQLMFMAQEEHIHRLATHPQRLFLPH